MSQSITAWLNRPDTAKLKKLSDDGELSTLFGRDFFRDPPRSIYYNPDVFYSPADGIVLYVHEKLAPKEGVVDVKGIKITLQELLHDETWKESCMVIGIFMTYLDVHVNRVPIDSSYIEERSTPFLHTHNVSMELLETGLLKDFRYSPVYAKYLFHNERKINRFFAHKVKSEYYIVQVADREVDVILNWDVGQNVKQGQRFGIVRWGSQVDLVIPLIKNVKLIPHVLPLDHVEGGTDVLVEVE